MPAEPKRDSAATPALTSHVFEIQNIYFNGFQLGVSNSDVGALLLLDGQPVGRLSMSFTTAKTLHVLLAELVAKLEQATDHNIMTTMDVERGMKKLKAQEEKN